MLRLLCELAEEYHRNDRQLIIVVQRLDRFGRRFRDDATAARVSPNFLALDEALHQLQAANARLISLQDVGPVRGRILDTANPTLPRGAAWFIVWTIANGLSAAFSAASLSHGKNTSDRRDKSVPLLRSMSGCRRVSH